MSSSETALGVRMPETKSSDKNIGTISNGKIAFVPKKNIRDR